MTGICADETDLGAHMSKHIGPVWAVEQTLAEIVGSLVRWNAVRCGLGLEFWLDEVWPPMFKQR